MSSADPFAPLPTPEQRAFLEKVMRSHVFSVEERAEAATFAARVDRQTLSERIDRVLAEVRERKRAEQQAKTEV
jgi:hypothetical protein